MAMYSRRAQWVVWNDNQGLSDSEKLQARNNIGAAAASDVTTLRNDVDALSNVSVYTAKGEATVAELNAGPAGIQAGWAYILTDAGTLTDGNLIVKVGDTVAWDGTKWFMLVDTVYYASKTYAENVAHSIAPAFDPTRTIDNPYKADESVVYTDGKVYTFKVDHYGAWNASDVYEDNIQSLISINVVKNDFFVIEKSNRVNFRIDTAYNVVAAWNGIFLEVPEELNCIEIENINSAGSYRVYFLSSNNLVAGSAAPVVYKQMVQIDPGDKEKMMLPSACKYVFVSTYNVLDVKYKFSYEDEIFVANVSECQIGDDGTLASYSSGKTYVCEVSNYAGRAVKLSGFSNNDFRLAYSIDGSLVSVGSSITLLSGSEISWKINLYGANPVYVPIPEGVKFLLISCYSTATISIELSDPKTSENKLYSKNITSSSDNYFEKCMGFVYGDKITFRAMGVYTASMAGISVTKYVVNSRNGIGYMSYGRLSYEVKAPILSLVRIIFTQDTTKTSYRIQVGPQLQYNVDHLRIASLNSGCFSRGTDTSNVIPPEDGPDFVATWIALLKKMDADVILFSEWNPNMTTGTTFPTKRKILANFQNVQESLTPSGYERKAIASMFDSGSITTVVYNNQYSTKRRVYSYEKMILNGEEIVVVVTHLELLEEYRALQIAELIAAFADYKRVIICGDFNTQSISEFEPFTEAGYDMANGDMWGVEYTYVGNSVSPAEDYPLDNIVVKGLKINNPRYPYDTDATDHKAVVADVYLI